MGVLSITALSPATNDLASRWRVAAIYLQEDSVDRSPNTRTSNYSLKHHLIRKREVRPTNLAWRVRPPDRWPIKFRLLTGRKDRQKNRHGVQSGVSDSRRNQGSRFMVEGV